MTSILPSTKVNRASAWKQAGLFAIFGLCYVAACDLVIVLVYGYQIRWLFDILIGLIVMLSTLIIYRFVASSHIEADNTFKELKYARFLLQSLLDSAPDYIYFKDTAGRFILVNNALAKFLQLSSPEEAIGKNDADIGQVEFAQAYSDDEEQVMLTGQSMVNKEELQRLANGNTAWISTTKMPLHDEQGKIIGTFGISRDITDIKTALVQQRELTASMNVVLEMTDALLTINDYDELLRRAVELPRERLGIERCSICLQADETHMQGTYGTDEKGNTTDERNISYEIPEHDWKIREYMERTGERWHGERKMLINVTDGVASNLYDGEGVLTPIMLHGERFGEFFNDNAITGKPIDPQRQEMLAVYCTLLGNILHRKKMELAFAQERSLLNALMTSAPDHIYFKDRESRFLRVSKSMMHLFDVDSMEQMIGKTDSDFFSIEHAYKALSDEKQIIATGIPLQNIEEKETWAGHEGSWVSTSKMPLYDETGNIIGTFGISRDITKRKHAEDSLRRLAEGMKKVLEMNEELLNCTTLDEVLQRAVELPRERLGIQRTGLYFLSEDGDKIEGTFGTDITGNTTDERKQLNDIKPASAAALSTAKIGDIRWLTVADTDLTEYEDGVLKTIKQGWKVITPVISSSNRRAVMFNDNARFGGNIEVLQQDLLAVFCNGLGNIIDRQEAISAQLDLARGMESVLKMTDELLSCPTMEELVRRAVELPREYLGLERTGLFFISDDIQRMHGSYGTDTNGNTTVEGAAHYGTSPWLRDAIKETELKDIHWVVAADDKLSEWKDGETAIVAHGWKVVTPMVSSSGHITVMFNDNGRFGGKIDPIKQDLLAVFCSELGNIIDRKQTEEELRKSEAKARRITDNMLDVITQLDMDNKIIYISPSAISVLGYQRAEILEHSAIDIIHPDDVDLVRAAIVEMRVKGMVRIEHRVRHRRGNYLWMETVAKPLFDEQGSINGAILSTRDISQRKIVEEELARSNAELQQFAYVASHDLQEPLRMVASYVQLLERRYKGKLDADADEFIGFAVDGATRMKVLINDLLTYSRVGSSNRVYTPVALAGVVKKSLQQLQLAVEDSGAVLDMDELPTVAGDETQLLQLFQNLIGNALKFHGKNPPQVQVSAVRSGDFWQLGIHDNGIGIDKQYMERIFIMFQRLHTKTQYPGTGIGLAVCKKIVERHGGRIWVDSPATGGSVFYFTLPVMQKGENDAN